MAKDAKIFWPFGVFPRHYGEYAALLQLLLLYRHYCTRLYLRASVFSEFRSWNGLFDNKWRTLVANEVFSIRLLILCKTERTN